MKILTYHYDSSTYVNTYSTNFIPFINMNTTIRYWLTKDQKCRYMSFSTYSEALNMIKTLSQIDVKSEVKLY